MEKGTRFIVFQGTNKRYYLRITLVNAATTQALPNGCHEIFHLDFPTPSPSEEINDQLRLVRDEARRREISVVYGLDDIGPLL